MARRSRGTILYRKKQGCGLGLGTFVLTKALGVPLAQEKTVLPTTSLSFLGIGIVSARGKLFAPADKRVKLLGCLHKLLSRPKTQGKSIASLLGLCNFRGARIATSFSQPQRMTNQAASAELPNTQAKNHYNGPKSITITIIITRS